jgi:hypothetical protein
MSVTLRSDPNFGLASSDLATWLGGLQKVEERCDALTSLNRSLGDEWFPIYLKLLIVIGEGAPEPARRLVAETIAHGMQHGQTTGGTLSSWGIPMPVPAAVASSIGQGFLRMSGGRILDPLAYLTVWFTQSTSREPLERSVFEGALAAVVRLFDASDAARSVYQAKLRADIASAPEGTFSSSTLLRLRCLLDAWLAGAAPHLIARDVARSELTPPSLRQIRLGGGPLV